MLKYVHGGEYHAYNPDVVMSLQSAVMSGEYADYQRYATHCNDRPVAALRDLLTLKLPESPVPLMKLNRSTVFSGGSILRACRLAHCHLRPTKHWRWE